MGVNKKGFIIAKKKKVCYNFGNFLLDDSIKSNFSLSSLKTLVLSQLTMYKLRHAQTTFIFDKGKYVTKRT